MDRKKEKEERKEREREKTKEVKRIVTKGYPSFVPMFKNLQHAVFFKFFFFILRDISGADIILGTINAETELRPSACTSTLN